MTPIEFSAPWGKLVKSTSIITTLFLLAISLLLTQIDIPPAPRIFIVAAPLAILTATALSAITGYTLTDREILIRRVAWTTRLPLQGLQSVEGHSDALRGSIRIFGNGGAFSLTGLFWNRRLKWFRAYATDRSRAVVLRYPQKNIVITPHDPQQFIMRARTYLQTRDFPR